MTHPPMPTAPACPIEACRQPATRQHFVEHDGYSEGYYLCPSGHTWITRWFVPDGAA